MTGMIPYSALRIVILIAFAASFAAPWIDGSGSGGRAVAEVPAMTTLAAVPTTPAAVPTTPAAVPTTPAADPTTPAAVPTAPAPSASAGPVVKGPPLRVQVGIFLLNVGRLDTSTGTYTMDFYLTMRCDRPCDPEPFELANGRITFQQLQEVLPNYKAFRIQAALSVGMDLRRYPFDRHSLGLVLEDSNRDSSALVYSADPQRSLFAADLQVAGWELSPGGVKARVEPQYYLIFDQTYSHYVASIEIHRPLIASLVKGLLPAVIMTMCGLISLLMSADKFNQRLSLSTSSLLGTVIYHLTMTSAIPPVAYLTFADRFMIGNYSCLLLTVVTTMLLMHFIDRSDVARTEWVRKWGLRVVPLLWASLQVINLFQL
jgi:hypothetical protein